MVGDKDTVSIVVNGRERIIPVKELSSNGEISFKQVVTLAFDPPPSGPDIIFTVSYRKGAGRPPEGTLVAGGRAKVQDGTVFNVSFTDKS